MNDPKIKQYLADQAKLDEMVKSAWSPLEYGVYYERYIGYLYESDSYRVDYSGIKKGFEDNGRDLIANNGKEIIVIQCKNWSREVPIHAKHIHQLVGTCSQLQQESKCFVRPVFATSGELSDEALRAAKSLGVELRFIAFDKNYPKIKCNINSLGKLYHLPFGKRYDYIHIDPRVGDCYVHTVQQAVELGFCSAYLYRRTG